MAGERVAATGRQLVPTSFGHHLESRKGQDGLRAQRVEIGGEPITMLLVCDGHGGSHAVATAIHTLFELFGQHSLGDPSSTGLQLAAEKAFRIVHDNLQEHDTTSGTTATLVLINEARAELTCCCVGDSFAALVEAPSPDDPKRMPVVTELTTNMRLDKSTEEQQRVRAAGGQIGRALGKKGNAVGPLRVWPGGLSCARALGDRDCAPLIDPKVCAPPQSVVCRCCPVPLLPCTSAHGHYCVQPLRWPLPICLPLSCQPPSTTASSHCPRDTLPRHSPL